MKGLKKYIKKHGKHFTEQLAHDACRFKWDSSKIKDSAQKQVYYNVTGATDGDMIYLMDKFRYYLSEQYTWNKSLKLTLKYIGDYSKTEYPFCSWLFMIDVYSDIDFDFTPYI